MSLGGRAVDMQLINAADKGKLITGSSNGTALRTSILQINDLGVGTDGGGSMGPCGQPL